MGTGTTTMSRMVLLTVVAASACGSRKNPVVVPAPHVEKKAPPAVAEAPIDTTGDPRALVADALAARGRADEAGARRAFEHARAAAEASGVHARVVPAQDYTLADPGRSGMPWSPDGRYVAYQHGSGLTRGLLVVDTQTWTSLRVDRGDDPMFSPDSADLVVSVGQGLTVYDLATGRIVVEKPSTTMRPRFLANDALAWADLEGANDVVYVRDSVGKQLALRAPHSAGPRDGGIREVLFAAPDRLVAWGSYGAADTPVHVFSIPERRLLATFDARPDSTKISGDRMFFTHKKGNASQLRIVGLQDPTHDVPQPTSKHPKCGAGMMDEGSRVLACTPQLVVVARDHVACEWELSTGKLTRTWPTGKNPLPACDRKQLPPPRRPTMMPMPRDFLDDPLGAGLDSIPSIDDPRDKLEDSKHGFGFAASPNGALVAGAVLDELDFANAPKRGGQIDPMSAITGGRPRIWNAAGKIVWSAPAPSGASSVAFAPNGDVVLAGRDGRVWHVTHATAGGASLRTENPPGDCVLDDFAVLPDGHTAMYCLGVEKNEVLRVEGAKPLADTPRYNSSARIATSATAASAMIASDAGLVVYTLPSGKVLWSSDLKAGVVPAHYDLTGTTLAPSGDRMALQSRGSSAVVDHDTVLWQKQEGIVIPNVFSPDGALVVMSPFQTHEPLVRDAATGELVDTLPGGGRQVVFTSATEVVYVREARTPASDTQLVVRDVRGKRDLATRVVPPIVAGWLDSLAASGRPASIALAAVTSTGIAFVWGADQAPSATIAAGGNAVAVTAVDGTFRLLGDAASARDHLACRIGDVLFPFEVCEGR